MPIVTECRLLAVDLPFRITFRHAAAARRSSESLFLRLRLDSGEEGWGESLPRSYVSGETREGAFALLRDEILPALVGKEFHSMPDVKAFLEETDGKAPSAWVSPDVPQTSAWCTVDLALIDAFGRQSRQHVSLGPVGAAPEAAPVPNRCRYSGVVPADRGWRSLVSLLRMRAFRFPHVKLKLEHDDAFGAARKARRVLGHRVDIRVDANMAWQFEEARATIAALSTIGIDYVEQPIAANDLAGLSRLVGETSSTIAVDEGMSDRSSLETLIRHRACTAVNVRISKCGGLVAAHARCREALRAGLVLQLGCQVGESSLLSAAHVALLSALAPLTPGVRYAEGCFGRHLLRDDPVSPSVQFRYGGRAPRPPSGHGLGVHVDQAQLERWAVDQVCIA
jgi:muconate cycloisomerase